MFILITDIYKKDHVVKKSDVKRVSRIIGKTQVSFTNKKENPAIYVKLSVKEFFEKYLTKKLSVKEFFEKYLTKKS